MVMGEVEKKVTKNKIPFLLRRILLEEETENKAKKRGEREIERRGEREIG